jgi:phosphatidate cytidylyltransferase
VKERIKGILMMLPLLLALFVGGAVIRIAALILSICGILEFRNAFKNKNIHIPTKLSIIACVCLFAQNLPHEFAHQAQVAMIAVLLLSAFLIIVNKHTIIEIALMWLGVFYIAFSFNEIVRIYEIAPNGMFLASLIFVIAFSTDVFAYLVGRAFGRNKLIPSVSPNKTIEGSVGGVVGAVLITWIYCDFTKLDAAIFVPISAIGSIVAQMGDLFASSIKRYCEVKDFGKLLPGHGGILDRFDSVLFVALSMSAIPWDHVISRTPLYAY